MKILFALLSSILALGAFADPDARYENNLQMARDVIPQDPRDDPTELTEKENEEDLVAEYEKGDTKDPVEQDPENLMKRDPCGPGTCERRRRRYQIARRRRTNTSRRRNTDRRRTGGTGGRRRSGPGIQRRRRGSWGKK